MKKFGSKDLMRMASIQDKARGDYMKQIMYSWNMACAISDPGKAMARGFAAQEQFGEHTACAAIFFERAYDIGGTDVRPMASANPWDTSEEGIESEFDNIPEHEQPASRRSERKELALGETIKTKRTPHSRLAALGKLNLIKGTGPQFNLFDYPAGTMEVWKNAEDKFRFIYTGHYESIFYINEFRNFVYESEVAGNKSTKNVKWVLIDYTDSRHAANLAPLYGKSVSIFCYD